VTEKGRETEVITRLARVGYDFTIGYLENGFETWQKAGKEIDQITSLDAFTLANIQASQNEIKILDVRNASEYTSEHINQVQNLPLDFINNSMSAIDKNQTYYVHCQGGYRSMIFISILKARGFEHLIDIKGGFKELKASGKFNIIENEVAPSLGQ
jgi:rhodanese-related sulfurtransferase